MAPHRRYYVRSVSRRGRRRRSGSKSARPHSRRSYYLSKTARHRHGHTRRSKKTWYNDVRNLFAASGGDKGDPLATSNGEGGIPSNDPQAQPSGEGVIDPQTLSSASGEPDDESSIYSGSSSSGSSSSGTESIDGASDMSTESIDGASDMSTESIDGASDMGTESIASDMGTESIASDMSMESNDESSMMDDKLDMELQFAWIKFASPLVDSRDRSLPMSAIIAITAKVKPSVDPPPLCPENTDDFDMLAKTVKYWEIFITENLFALCMENNKDVVAAAFAGDDLHADIVKLCSLYQIKEKKDMSIGKRMKEALEDFGNSSPNYHVLVDFAERYVKENEEDDEYDDSSSSDNNSSLDSSLSNDLDDNGMLDLSQEGGDDDE